MKILRFKSGNIIKVFAETIESEALEQIKSLGEFKAYSDSKIRIMPDCHAGAGCVIGTTMTISDKVTPNLVGVDIGCGMLTVKLRNKEIDLEQLDMVINKYVPSGSNIHSETQAMFDFDRLRCKNEVDIVRASKSVGTLGGGNHFIEAGENSQDELFLVIHSGSRNLGLQVANYYQNLAWKNAKKLTVIEQDLVESLKQKGRKKGIKAELKKLKKPKINKDLSYVSGADFDNYMHDMRTIQKYAVLNRRTIADIIFKNTELIEDVSFETIHNYIDFKRMILRKGAISAERDEIVLIPINMRDGSVIAKGKGNPDWNYSAPHGAGRLMSRKKAKQNLDLEVFKKQMEGIYSTSVSRKTLDEAPDAYKPIDEILSTIDDSVDIVDVIKPIYNFKAHT